VLRAPRAPRSPPSPTRRSSDLESGRGLNVLAGTGAASLEDAAEITRDAFDAGCDAAVIIPPFFYKGASDDGLFDFFVALIRRAVDRKRTRLNSSHVKTSYAGFC